MNIPSIFKISKLAPTMQELEWLHHWLKENIRWTGYGGGQVAQEWMILEFGCGITTYVIANAICLWYSYHIIETYQPNIDSISEYITENENDYCDSNEILIYNNWDHIKDELWDIIFVDSSCGCGLKGYHREKTIQAAEPFMADDCIVAIHDWRRRGGQKPRAYLESNGYKLIACYDKQNGIGVYQKG